MTKVNYKGKTLSEEKFIKCKETPKLYHPIQMAFARFLDKDTTIKEFQCNVYMQNLEVGEYYADFLCIKDNGDLMVRECITRKRLTLPRSQMLLDASRQYWVNQGITDWGIIIDAKE